MKRDMNLVRSLLLIIEENDDGRGGWVKIEMTDVSRTIIVEHLYLMADAGLVEGEDTSSMGAPDYQVTRLTWEGHDFLDSVRDQDIWDKTQDGMKKAGGFSLDLVKALAKGLIKKNIERYTGVEIDL